MLCVVIYIFFLGQGFASPNSGRSSNTKNIINSLTKNRKRSHQQPSINIPPFPVSFRTILNFCQVINHCLINGVIYKFCFNSPQILVQIPRVATVRRLRVPQYNPVTRHTRIWSRNFIFRVSESCFNFWL